MAKPTRKRTRGGRGTKGKGETKGGKLRTHAAKPVARKTRVAAPKAARPEVKAAKRPSPPATPVAPKAGPAVQERVEERKEGHMAEAKQLTPSEFVATVLVPQFSRDTGHICWDCKHFKPVLKGSKFPPSDTIGWCTQIHWPFFWCVTDFNVVKKCYTFEKGVYSPYQPQRFKV
jgi:hypothetical protein